MTARITCHEARRIKDALIANAAASTGASIEHLAGELVNTIEMLNGASAGGIQEISLLPASLEALAVAVINLKDAQGNAIKVPLKDILQPWVFMQYAESLRG